MLADAFAAADDAKAARLLQLQARKVLRERGPLKRPDPVPLGRSDEAADEDRLMEIALEAGADDIQEDETNFEILSAPENFEKVNNALQTAQIPVVSAEVAMVPQTWIKLTGSDAQKILKLVEALEDHDDVQHVWANFDIEEEELVRLAG